MTDKEQLTELIMRSRAELITRPQAEEEADYLLANKVKVLPCNINDTIYVVGKFTGQILLSVVKCISYSEHDVFLRLENNTVVAVEQQLGETVFLSREAAEAKLNEMVGDNP